MAPHSGPGLLKATRTASPSSGNRSSPALLRTQSPSHTRPCRVHGRCPGPPRPSIAWTRDEASTLSPRDCSLGCGDRAYKDTDNPATRFRPPLRPGQGAPGAQREERPTRPSGRGRLHERGHWRAGRAPPGGEERAVPGWGWGDRREPRPSGELVPATAEESADIEIRGSCLFCERLGSGRGRFPHRDTPSSLRLPLHPEGAKLCTRR